MARCLRCKAGNEWIEGDAPASDERLAREIREALGAFNDDAKPVVTLVRELAGARYVRGPVAEQEPVAWRWRRDSSMVWNYATSAPLKSDAFDIEPLYGHPWLKDSGGEG